MSNKNQTAGEYPPLPQTEHWLKETYTASQMRAYVDADRAMRAKATSKNLLQVQAWVIPDGNGGGQFSWQKQDERYWTRLTPPAQVADSVTAPAGGAAAGIEAAAKLLERKADDFARENAIDDLGGLSFGRGAHADAKLEYHSTLLELAEEIRSLAAAPTTQAARPAYAEMPDERAAFEALARTEWRWPDDFFWRHSQTHEYTREPAMSAWIAWQAALRASHGQAPVAHGDALDEVRRAVAAIAVVGHVDGHAVVRRLSVLDMLDRRIAARAQAKEGDQHG